MNHDNIYNALMEIKEGQGSNHALTQAIHDKVTRLERNHTDLDKRVTALEHLKITIIATATAIGGIFGLFWEKIKTVVGHIIA